MKKGILILLISLILPITTISQGWTPTKRLSWNTGNSEWPVITHGATSSYVHVFWADNSFGNFEILQKSSTDKGTTWLALNRLTWTSGHSRYPHAISNTLGKIFVTWVDETPGNKEIFFKKSTDNGVSWSGTKRITWTSGSSSYPFLQFDHSGYITVFWQERISFDNEEIFYKKSITDGNVWGKTNRFTWTSRDSRGIRTAVDSSNIFHAVWFDWTSSEFDIFYKHGTMGGLIWSSPQRLTWTPNSCMDPSIVVAPNGNILVTWTYDGELYFKKSTDGGTSWSSTKRLTWNPGNSIRPFITTDLYNNPYVIWDDDSSGNNEIYYKNSNNSGDTWSPLYRLTWNKGQSLAPSMITDQDSDIHVTWSDDTPGNFEIFYKTFLFVKILNNKKI